MTAQIFISYARDDDAPPPDAPDSKGFVTFLHEQLAYELKQLGPVGTHRPLVWRDTKGIERGRQFEPELEEQIRSSALLLVVLSGNWLASEWCRRELAQFESVNGGLLERALRERIICVGKLPVPPESRPSRLHGQEGFNLFGQDPLSGDAMDYFDRGKVLNAEYVKLVKEMARYAHRQLETCAGDLQEPRIEQPVVDPPAPKAPTGRAVFVAWPARDMEIPYQSLVKELADRNFRVVPMPVTPQERLGVLGTRAEAEASLGPALAEAALSIHLLGDSGGMAPDGAPPLAMFQLELAASRMPQAVNGAAANSSSAFRRLVWAPRVLPDAAAGAVERDPLAVAGRFGLASLLPGDKVEGDVLAKFVQFAIQRLDALPLEMPPEADGEGMRVLLQFRVDPRLASNAEPGRDTDLGLAFEVFDGLAGAGFTPVMPPLDDDVAREEAERQVLRGCEAVVLCWADSPDVWVRANVARLEGWREFGRNAPFRCRGVIMGPPEKLSKRVFRHTVPRTKDVDVVVDVPPSGAIQESLQPLLQRLRAEGPPT